VRFGADDDHAESGRQAENIRAVHEKITEKPIGNVVKG
jgi:hypothetical protein